MIEIIFPAIGIGILLSLFLIGPVFFLLIETSLTKGYRSAIVLDFGVIFSDILCVTVAYYGSQDIDEYIKSHLFLYRIGGLIVMIYGLYIIFSKGNSRINEDELIVTNYFKIFINGFLFNLVNVGVVAFWVSLVFLIRTEFGHQNFDFFLFIFFTFMTFIIIDLCKIFLAQLFKSKLTDHLMKIIKKIMGIVLVIFGIIFFLKSFKLNFFEKFNKKNGEKIFLNYKKIIKT